MSEQPKSRQQIREEADVRILEFLIESEGLARTIRLLQYAIEKRAADILKPQAGAQSEISGNLSKASDELETAYLKIKNEFKL
jgi:hypothetical protein